jgi:hypothetical protein
MRKIAIALSALLLIAAATQERTAQHLISAEAAPRPIECSKFRGCLDGALSEARTRDPRIHARVGHEQGAAAPASSPSVMILSSRSERSETLAASQPTWREAPSLMDSSWRRWPSLIDF